MGSNIEAVGESILRSMEKKGFAAGTIGNYRGIFRGIAAKHLEAFGSCAFSDESLDELVSENNWAEKKDWNSKRSYRACQMLKDHSAGREAPYQYRRKPRRLLRCDGDWLTDDYRLHLEKKGQKPTTVQTDLERLGVFFEYAEGAGKDSLSDVEPWDITQFGSLLHSRYSDAYASNVLRTLKGYLSFAYSLGAMDADLSLMLIRLPDTRCSSLPSVYSDDEVKLMLSSVDRTTAAGKRDYAIATLVAELGIREVDVALMEIDDVDLVHREVSVVQEKTGRALRLPLTDSLLKALYDYLMDREDENPLLFPRLTSAYSDKPMSGAGIYHAVSKHMRASGLADGSRRHGPHSLRHSLATSMTDGETPFNTTAEILGHASSETTRVYGKVSMGLLGKLALEVPARHGK